MGQNQNSVVVLQIRVKFWWMIPMGVKYNHTKFEQETQWWRPGTGFASGCIFGPKKPWNTFKTAKRRETMGMCQVRLDFTVSTSSLRPSNSMICPGNGPKRPPQAPNADNHKPRIGHIFGYMAQNAIPRAPIPPEPPTFCGFHPSKLPKRTPRPQYLGPLGCGKLQAQAQTGGYPNGSTGSSRGKKMTFLWVHKRVK